MTKNYKQILIICGLIIVIIVCTVIYFYQNKNEDYSYLEISNDISQTNIIEEVKAQIVVHITGQVVNPGVVKVEEGARIIDAIEASGGATLDANLSKINLAYVLEDGMKIYVPSINEVEEIEYVTSSSGNEDKSASKTIKVNINTATSEELQSLPGIGESIANRIITYRKENGKFSKIEDLTNVSGIGEAKFNNIKSYVFVK